MNVSAPASLSLHPRQMGFPSDEGARIRSAWFSQSQRVAVAMWDFSWLVRRTANEAEYADWERSLDELVERGYNCVRIDPFPHLLSAGEGSVPQDEFSIPAQPRSFMWGNHRPVTVAVRESLRRFLQAVKRRPLTVALSSWFLDDATRAKLGVATPDDFAAAWLVTLRLLEAEGLLDRVLWVDLCNEFPMSIWAPRAYQRIFRTSRSHSLMPSALVLGRPWGRHAIQTVERYLAESIGRLRRHYPQLRYTFSFQEFGASNLARIDLSPLDLIEAHIWASDDMWWSILSEHYKAALGFRDGVRKHAERANNIYARHRERCIRILNRRMDFWKQLAQKYDLPLVTTEGWVSTFYDDVEIAGGRDAWAWFKDLTEAAVELAIDKGWSGICSSNFCQPHFPQLWSDVNWHRQTCQTITSRTKASERSARC